MGIKQILLHLDHSSGCQKRVEVAIELSQRFEARLRGVFVLQNYVIPAYAEAQVSMEMIAEVHQQSETRAKKSIADCRAIAKAAGLSMETKLEEGSLTPILREYSKYADLIITGQDNPDDPDNTSYVVADDMLLEAACASLVVPHSGNISAPGKRVLLAWNASREAARAVRAAMPLLQQAQQLVVLSSPAEKDGEPRDREIIDYLKSHGVKSISSETAEPGISAAESIVTQASEMHADMIVMGAYGHMRLREIILGGTTRELIKKAPLPLLMAH